MRTVGAVTVARSDYGIYRPVFRAIEATPGLSLRLFVSGAHLSPEFGMTVGDIEKDGFEIEARVDSLLSSDSPGAIARSLGLGVIGFSQAFERWRPDLLLVLGDRFDMLAAALAALPFRIPVAHLHGGERTAGAMDDAFRHAMTKLSHLHFVATEEYGRRVAQLGEEPWRISVTGSPAIDNLAGFEPMPPAELAGRFGLDVSRPFLLVTFHPVTLEPEDRAEAQAQELFVALRDSGWPAVVTMPNADTRGRAVRAVIREIAQACPQLQVVETLGTRGYFSALARASAMVGNSSSGIVEAASFRLPVVNVGRRQEGRERGANVIDVPCDSASIRAAIERATAEAFSRSLDGLANPFGDGTASSRIAKRLAEVELNEGLIVKGFVDWPRPAAGE
ncbi:MAG: UDP-N-acetylglucosamine 2-epimerase [Thermoanaerobaculia bacterium]